MKIIVKDTTRDKVDILYTDLDKKEAFNRLFSIAMESCDSIDTSNKEVYSHDDNDIVYEYGQAFFNCLDKVYLIVKNNYN